DAPRRHRPGPGRLLPPRLLPAQPARRALRAGGRPAERPVPRGRLPGPHRRPPPRLPPPGERDRGPRLFPPRGRGRDAAPRPARAEHGVPLADPRARPPRPLRPPYNGGVPRVDWE